MAEGVLCRVLQVMLSQRYDLRETLSCGGQKLHVTQLTPGGRFEIDASLLAPPEVTVKADEGDDYQSRLGDMTAFFANRIASSVGGPGSKIGASRSTCGLEAGDACDCRDTVTDGVGST